MSIENGNFIGEDPKAAMIPNFAMEDGLESTQEGIERDAFYDRLHTTKSQIEPLGAWPTADQLREARAKLPDPREELRKLNRQVVIVGIPDVDYIKLRG